MPKNVCNYDIIFQHNPTQSDPVCFEYCIRAMMYGWVRSHWYCWVPESQQGLPVYDALINMFPPLCRGVRAWALQSQAGQLCVSYLWASFCPSKHRWYRSPESLIINEELNKEYGKYSLSFITKAVSRDAKQHIIQQHLCMTVSPLSHVVYICLVGLTSPYARVSCTRESQVRYFYTKDSEKLRTLPKVTQLTKEQRPDWNSSFPDSPSVLFLFHYPGATAPSPCLFLFWYHVEIQSWFPGYQVLLSGPKQPSLMNKISLMTHE